MFGLSDVRNVGSHSRESAYHVKCGVSNPANAHYRDLLRRHYKTIHVPPVEDDDLASDQNSVSLINRIPIACVNCAQSKTKCDKQVCIKIK